MTKAGARPSGNKDGVNPAHAHSFTFKDVTKGKSTSPAMPAQGSMPVQPPPSAKAGFSAKLPKK